MSGPRRVAILGGGLAGLTAAHELSKTAALRRAYAVTVYQMGWRFGGKAASGRGRCGRVEEHGLHLFFGFYDNAFSLVRSAYDELDGPGNLASWQDAFAPQHSLDLWHRHRGDLRRWTVAFPRNDDLPGDPHPPWTLAELLERGLSFSLSLATRAVGLPAAPSARLGELLGALRLPSLEPLLARAWSALERPDESDGRALATDLGVRWLGMRRHLGRLADRNYAVYRAFVAVDWILTVMRGALHDGLARAEGWKRIDDLDYREWLQRHGATARTLDSALVRAYYSAVLAVPAEGHIPAAAGTALRTQLRMFLTYRGAFLNKIRAGLGDSVVAPLYKVLRRRGVEMRLFHQVLDVVPDGRTIGAIRMRKQARTRGDYNPLIRVGGLDAWPNEPQWDQLHPADRAYGHRRFEHSLGLPQDEREHGEPVELRRGHDFDDVVFALPLGAIAGSAPSLLASNPRWHATATNVRDIATQSIQLWLDKSPRELGWTGPAPFSTTHAPPLDTWSDQSFVLDHEAWPNQDRPKGLLYFTGFFDDAAVPDDLEAVQQAHERGDATLRHYAERVLPNLLGPRAQLFARAGTSDALTEQFVTTNIEPWERYVLASPGTNVHRIPAHDCGFDNLTVAGDWTDNDIYSGCAEGAVVSGQLAAQALGSGDVNILGAGAW